MDYRLPGFYFEGYVDNFAEKAEKYHLCKTVYKKNSLLTVSGTINNTSHFIQKGIVHLTLTHSSGNQKGIGLFGPDTVFPLGVVTHENLIDYEMIIRAVTDVEVYSFSYPQLRQMCVEDGEFAAKLLEENCDFIGYLFYQEMNQSYESCHTRICDFLYLYHQASHKMDVALTQGELAGLVGSSIKQLERTFKDLREKQIIQTAHKKIHILNPDQLLEYCSDDIKGR